VTYNAIKIVKMFNLTFKFDDFLVPGRGADSVLD